MAFSMFAYPRINLQDYLHSRRNRKKTAKMPFRTVMKDAGGLSKRREEGKGEEEG